jgi:hypothetical protein
MFIINSHETENKQRMSTLLLNPNAKLFLQLTVQPKTYEERGKNAINKLRTAMEAVAELQ